MADFQPLMVSDVRDEAWYEVLKANPGYLDAMTAWLRANGVDPDDTYRWELYLLDCPFVRVFAYDRDEMGRRRWQRIEDVEERCRTGVGWRPVEREPYTVLVSSMPPQFTPSASTTEETP